MKKIGIPGWVIDNKVFGITLPYAEFIRKFGELVILTPDEPFRDDIDLLFLPGGADIPASRYTDKISMYSGNSNSMLDHFDSIVLPDYINNGTPIFGVCRGAQLLFTYFGGKLDQHNFTHTQSTHPKDECHPLAIDEKFMDIYGFIDGQYVNSRHHQTMVASSTVDTIIKPIAYGVDVTGYGNNKKGVVNKNIIEIFTIQDRPIYGTQYHPEDCVTETFSSQIIQKLLIKAS